MGSSRVRRVWGACKHFYDTITRATSVLFTSTPAAIASPLIAMLGTSQSTHPLVPPEEGSYPYVPHAHQTTHRSLRAPQLSPPPGGALAAHIAATANHHDAVTGAHVSHRPGNKLTGLTLTAASPHQMACAQGARGRCRTHSWACQTSLLLVERRATDMWPLVKSGAS